jgi:hypothetical protein
MRIDVTDYPSTAVEVNNNRCDPRALRAIDPNRNISKRPRDYAILGEYTLSSRRH